MQSPGVDNDTHIERMERTKQVLDITDTLCLITQEEDFSKYNHVYSKMSAEALVFDEATFQ